MLAAAAAGCERAPLAAAGPGPSVPRATAFAQSATVGGMDRFGHIEPTALSIRVPSPRWVRLRATGTVQLEANPFLMDGDGWFCSNWSYLCFPPHDGRSVGPEGFAPCAGCATVLDVGFYAGISSSLTDREPVVFLLPEWHVSVTRRGYYAEVPFDGRLIPMYTVRGGDLRVEAQEVAPPYTITVSDTLFRTLRPVWVTLGGGEPDPGYRTFVFVPGDTAAEPQWWGRDAGFRPKYLACGDATCTVYLEEAGRVYAVVRHRGSEGYIAGPVLRPFRRPSTPRLVLACTGDLGANRVTRGDMIRCAARASGSGTVNQVITGWSFEGRPRTDASPTSAVWEGEMAKSGKVVVYWSAGANTRDSAFAPIEVVERKWNDPTLPPAEERFAACTPPLTRDCPIGYPPVHFQDMGRTVPTTTRQYVRMRINSGPNTGYNFIAGDDFFLRYSGVVIFLNELLRNASDPYFRDPQFSERRRCNAALWLEEVRQHELTHYRLLKEGLATAGLAARWESDVFYGSLEDAGRHYTSRSVEMSAELLDLGDHRHLLRTELFPAQNPDCYVGLQRNPERTSN